MLHRLKLSQKMLILVAVPLLFEFAFIMALNQLLEQAEEERQNEMVTRMIIAHVNEIHRVLLDNASVGAGFSMTMDRDEREKRSRSLRDKLDKQSRELERLLKDKPQARAHFERAQAILDESTVKLRALKRMFRHEGLLAVRDEVKVLFGKLTDELDRILEEERKAEALIPKVQQEQRARIQATILMGVVLNTVIAIGLVVFLTREITGRLSILMDNTVRLARGLPLNPSLKGDDELTHLDRVFKEMAGALAIAAMRERAVVEYSADMIFSIVRSGHLQKVSQAANALLGLAPEELVEKHYLQFVVEEDKESTARALEGARAAGESASFENRMKRKDGAIVNTLWSVTWSDADETFYCVAHDITQRKQAEQLIREAEARTRQILKSLPVGLVIVTPQGKVEYANQPVQDMLALDSEQLLGREFNNLLSERCEDKTAPRNVVEGALEHVLEYEIATELPGAPASRRVLPLELSFRRIETIDGERLLGLIVDITERHEIERLKQDFVSMVSHDLRTPLTSVQSYLELLADGIYGELNAPGLERLALLEKSIDRLVKLICDLLDLDRLESGSLNLKLRRQGLGSMIDQMQSACLALREEKGVEVVAPKTSLKLVVDGDRIAQVLVNLVSNAIKFSPEGGKVTVSVKKNGSVVDFRVSDQGPGIPPQYQRTIFDRFKQAPEGEERKGGTGLGLAISKAIVEQHGGRIGVESEIGKGSTFWFKLPHAPESEELI